MNKTRIILAATTVVLAIAGVFATKANTKRVTVFYQAPNACVALQDPCPLDRPGPLTCTYTPAAGFTYTVYTTQQSLTTCANPIKYKIN